MSRILYVEDNCLLQLDGAAALTEAGYDVNLADDGAAACDLLGNRSVQYDALITDIDLPGDIQGWRVATAMRKHNGRLPVIYVTGHAACDFRAMRVAHSIMIEKPFQWPSLLKSLSDLLSAAALGHQGGPASWPNRGGPALGNRSPRQVL